MHATTSRDESYKLISNDNPDPKTSFPRGIARHNSAQYACTQLHFFLKKLFIFVSSDVSVLVKALVHNEKAG